MQRSVLITGASRGIGRACAIVFAKAGYRVGLNYCHSQEAAEALTESINASGGNACCFCADVADFDALKTMFESFGHTDVLINNAGVSCDGLLTELENERWERCFDVNVTGAFYCCKLVLPQMISDRSGCILNVSSMWGRTGASCEVAYSASKAALIGMSKALAKELGPSNVRVNCVAPGVIDTDMNSLLSSEDMDALREETPLMRIGSPEDVANALLFLASDSASFITGQVLGVDGGFVI